SFLWATHYCEALATYPEVGRAEPARVPAEAGTPSLFGLAPCGVCPARRITAAAVRSYRTFSPLPRPCGRGGMFSVALSVESFPSLQKCKDGTTLPDVIRHTALRSSDFPLPPPEGGGSDRPVRLPTYSLYSMPVGVIGSRWQVRRDRPADRTARRTPT